MDQRLGQTGAVVGVGQGVDELADGRTDLAAEAKRLGDFVRPPSAGRSRYTSTSSTLSKDSGWHSDSATA